MILIVFVCFLFLFVKSVITTTKIMNGCCFSITGILQIFIISITLVNNKPDNSRGDSCEITGDLFSGEDLLRY